MNKEAIVNDFLGKTANLQKSGATMRTAVEAALVAMIEDIFTATVFDFEGYGEAADTLYMLEVSFAGLSEEEGEVAGRQRVEALARLESEHLVRRVLCKALAIHHKKQAPML